MRTFTHWSLLVPGLVLGTLPAHAASKQMPWEATPPPRVIEDRLRLDMGVWSTGVETVLREDATPTQPGTALDGESDTGLADSELMADIELTLLPGKRNVVRVMGFSSHRSGSAVLTRNISFDGNIYRTGQTVKSVFNLDMLGVGYAWRLLKAPTYELDLGLDVQITALEANVYVPQMTIREADEGVLPIPMVDIDGRWEVHPKWWLQARYRWLDGSGDEVTGSISDWRVGVQWQFSQHFGVGLHYRSFDVAVDSVSSSNPGALRLNFKGPQLAVRASL